jgi:hypothetical protein
MLSIFDLPYVRQADGVNSGIWKGYTTMGQPNNPWKETTRWTLHMAG